MKFRLITLLTSLFAPVMAFATNGVGVLEMHPYVTGRDFPWAVPVIGVLLLVAYLARTVAAYRAIEGH
jgi:hypothetical protein